jgi:hypothetical protein
VLNFAIYAHLFCDYDPRLIWIKFYNISHPYTRDKNMHNRTIRLTKTSIQLKLSQIDYFEISNWTFFRDRRREFPKEAGDHSLWSLNEFHLWNPLSRYFSTLETPDRITSHPLDSESRLYSLFPRDIFSLACRKILFAKLKSKGF